MTVLSLLKPHEYAAEWHLPGSAHTISGQLSYSSERAELQLHDAFTPVHGDLSISDTQPIYPAVHGASTRGDALTLLKAQRLGISLNFGSAGLRQPERLFASWVVVGAYVEPETLYSAVRFFIPGLEVWLSKPAIHQTSEQDSATGRFTDTFLVRSPEIDTTPVPAIHATLEWGVGTTSAANAFKSIAVDVRGWVVVRPDAPQLLEWFVDQQSKLAMMLALMAGVPMSVDAMDAYIVDSRRPVSVLVTLRQAEVCAFQNLHDFFIPRSEVDAHFASLVANWFLEIDSVLVPSQLALSILSTKNLWLHIEFLSLIQALEGFHRGRYAGNYMPDAEYDTVKATLSGAIPTMVDGDHRDALRSRIRYGNQISLGKRLNVLRDYLGDALASLIISSDGKIPRKWIDTRNYHTHWDEDLRANTIDGQEMYNANVRIEHFLRAIYLLMMGIQPETLIRCLQNTSGTSQQLHQLNVIARRKSDPTAPAGVLMTIGALPCSSGKDGEVVGPA